MGRPPADEPDVYVFVPQLHVGELNIDVERLEAHLALKARSRTSSIWSPASTWASTR
jgi:hypothetical protein